MGTSVPAASWSPCATAIEPGSDTIAFFGASITNANLVMSDGVSLERRGVVPGETMLPTASDLAANRDPVLAHAAEPLGYKLAPTQAVKLFPISEQAVGVECGGKYVGHPAP